MEARNTNVDWSLYGKRAKAFKLISQLVASGAKVIETGTARSPYDTMGNGASTMLFDQLGYHVYTIDIDPRSQHAAKKLTSDRVKYLQGDSVSILEELALADKAQDVSLVFLDSMDYSLNNKAIALRSEEHHLAELHAIYASLPPGCLIAIDDCHSDEQGKHVMAGKELDALGCERVLYEDSYVRIWRKSEQ